MYHSITTFKGFLQASVLGGNINSMELAIRLLFAFRMGQIYLDNTTKGWGTFDKLHAQG